MQYVVKVRNRYLDKPDVYRYHPFIASSTDYFVTGYPFRACRTFLGILANFNSAEPDYKKVLSDIAALFRDQADLLVEFACFFPVAEQDKVPNCAFYGGCRVSLNGSCSLHFAGSILILCMFLLVCTTDVLSLQAREYLLSVTAASSASAAAPITNPPTQEFVCVTPAKRLRTGKSASTDNGHRYDSAAGVTEEPVVSDQEELVPNLPSGKKSRGNGKVASGNGRGKKGPASTGAHAVIPFPDVAVPDDEAAADVPQAPVKQQRRLTTAAKTYAEVSGSYPTTPTAVTSATTTTKLTQDHTQQLAEQDRRLSALECRVEWQHKRIYDLSCQVRGLQSACTAAEAGLLRTEQLTL
jgi:hypothetical protein